MKQFADLVRALDQDNRTSRKVQHLADYLRSAPREDAAWALWVLSGRKVRRAVSSTDLKHWLADASGHPLWLVEECHQAVGDLAETLALLAPQEPDGSAIAPRLHVVMEERVVPLHARSRDEARAVVEATWHQLDDAARFVFNKLLTGAFRLGVGRKLTVRALAEAFDLDPLRVAHRMTGHWHPTVEDFARITAVDGDATEDPGRPYPFFLAHSVDDRGELEQVMGSADEWHAEWKWDGIRAQIICRDSLVLIWSRGEELVTDQFPELAEAAASLPAGTVLDGEVLAWGPEGVMPFSQLQRRLNRKKVGVRLRSEVPVVFMAYDLLEQGGRDLRAETLEQRRGSLIKIVDAWSGLNAPAAPSQGGVIRVSPGVSPLGAQPDADPWLQLAELQASARERGVEGLMLKRKGSPYRQGRVRGDWFKWKVEPLTLDAVMLYAQRGHGRRASLYTDYTFGVWHAGELVPIAKAYSGLSDSEIREVDRWVRQHTTERFGPVRAVDPDLVFELAFDAVRRSPRHRSGLALRFPRIARWRRDKPAAEADTLERVNLLLPAGERAQ